MQMIGLTKKDLANVGSGAGFKEAAERNITGVLQGIGLLVTERLNEDEELEPVTISVVKVGDTVYSGASKVIEGRIKNLMDIVGDTADVQEGKIEVKFELIKLARGMGTNMIVVGYDE